jgi:DNA-binding transcriptional ArsR family regulator
MTEEKVKDIHHEEVKSSDDNKRVESWGLLVTKSTVRLKIWQILELFGQLNVTQISNLLKESKSTVSRHLNGMLEDGLVLSKEDEACCPGRIAPKLFSINHDIRNVKSGIEMEQGYPKDFNERIEYIGKEIQTNRSSIDMIAGIMRLLEPIYDEVENLIKENTPESLKKADEIFLKYMWGPNGENITWFTFAYQTPKMYFLQKKISDFSYKILKEDYDSSNFEEERQELMKELNEARKEQQDSNVPKKYARLGIMLPLRKIFKKNQEK